MSLEYVSWHFESCVGKFDTIEISLNWSHDNTSSRKAVLEPPARAQSLTGSM